MLTVITINVTENSGVSMGHAGCAMHKGPAVREPLWGPSGIGFSLSDTDCSQINWNLRFSTCTHSLNSCVSVKRGWMTNCWFNNQPACHTHRGSSFNRCMSDVRKHPNEHFRIVRFGLSRTFVSIVIVWLNFKLAAWFVMLYAKFKKNWFEIEGGPPSKLCTSPPPKPCYATAWAPSRQWTFYFNFALIFSHIRPIVFVFWLHTSTTTTIHASVYRYFIISLNVKKFNSLNMVLEAKSHV